MKTLTRRDFLKTTALTTTALGLSPRSWSQVAGANNDIRVAQIGFHSQGAGHINTLREMKGVRLVALCDVDHHVLDAKAKELGGDIQTYPDIRKLLENKEVDAVSIAVPNHWHALATIWACQAGKDVYVEKPACYNIFEGQKMIEAARKYGRIVQCGTQCRSAAGIQEGVHYVREGNLGKIVVARGFCYKARKRCPTTSITICGAAPPRTTRRGATAVSARSITTGIGSGITATAITATRVPTRWISAAGSWGRMRSPPSPWPQVDAWVTRTQPKRPIL